MKKLLWSSLVAVLVLAGCGEKKQESTQEQPQASSEIKQEAAMPAQETPAQETPSPIQQTQPSSEQPATEEQATPKEATGEVAKEETQATESKEHIDAAKLYATCAGCHGAKGEKQALGKSNIIAGQSKEDLVMKLKGYKDGSYGGAMKTLMKGQVDKLDDKAIDALAEHIAGLK